MTVWRSEEKKQASWSIGRPAQVLGGIGTLNLQRISLLLVCAKPRHSGVCLLNTAVHIAN